MREIKFRAWHTELKKMFSPEEMGEDQLTLMPDGRGFANISSINFKSSEIDNGRKMMPLQYTGLKDKNGKEIYEGDIVVGWNGTKYEVMWLTDRYVGQDYKAWRQGYYDAYIPLSEIGQVGLDNQFTNDLVEVIGNIYENPELIV